MLNKTEYLKLLLTRTFSNLADATSPAEIHVFSKCCALCTVRIKDYIFSEQKRKKSIQL